MKKLPFHFAPTPMAVLCRSDLELIDKALVGVLLYHAGGDGRCFPTHATLARELCTNVRCVKRSVRRLEAVGLVTHERSRYCNYYSVNVSVFAEIPDGAQTSYLKSPDRAQMTPQIGPKCPIEENKKRSSSKEEKKKGVFPVREKTLVRPAAVPEPQGENPKSPSKIHDDDQKPQPLSKTKWASDRDELIATIQESTGERPDRKLLRQIDDAVQSRGGTLRAYLDDIRPRIGRLKRKPGLGFFYQHARNWGGSEQRQAPEPQQQAPKCSCRFGQIEVDGEWRPCPECRLGQDLAKMNALLAKEREAARTQKVAEEPAA